MYLQKCFNPLLLLTTILTSGLIVCLHPWTSKSTVWALLFFLNQLLALLCQILVSIALDWSHSFNYKWIKICLVTSLALQMDVWCREKPILFPEVVSSNYLDTKWRSSVPTVQTCLVNKQKHNWGWTVKKTSFEVLICTAHILRGVSTLG